MSMAQFIQDAWNRKAGWLLLLRPLSWVYGAVFRINKLLYQSGIKQTYTAPVPVMVIGNITIGGSGKTPLIIQLVKYLQQHHVKVAVISRGYGGKGPFPALVDENSVPQQVGDEPTLIVQRTKVPMAVGADRQKAIELLLQHHQVDIILSDDGLQHWALQRQIEWVVLDSQRGLGNERLLPEGFLREPKSRLQQCTVIEHTYQSNRLLSMHLRLGKPYLLHSDNNTHHSFDFNHKFHVVVGIGFPQRFYQSLIELGIDASRQICHEFPDHYTYTLNDLSFDDTHPLITTEKDAVKIKSLIAQHPHLLTSDIWVLPVDAVLSDDCYAVLQQQLQQLKVSIH
ncbi:MAG: tetraacyldisaccharide 4'-kinase [Acinetobacter sp.]